MDYARILAQAWDYTKRFKGLWLFGLLATCGTYQGRVSGNFNFNMDLRPRGSEVVPPGLPPRMAQWFEQMGRFLRHLNDTQALLLTIALIAFILGISLVVWVLGRFGKAGVLRGVFSIAASGEEAPALGALARQALNFAARLLLADLVVLAAGFALSLILMPLFIIFGILTLGIGFLLGICVLFPVLLLFKLYVHLVHVVLVAEPEVGIFEAFSLAWRRLREHFGEWLLMGLILGLIGFIVGLILLIPIIILVLGIVFAFKQGVTPLVFLFLALFLLYLLLAWLVGGLLETFRLSAWALTYRELVPVTVEDMAAPTDIPLTPLEEGTPPAEETPTPPEEPSPPDPEASS